MQQFLIGLAIVVLMIVAIVVSDRLIFGRWRSLGAAVAIASPAYEVAFYLALIGALLLVFSAFRYLIRSTLEVFDWSVARLQRGSWRNKRLPPRD